MRKIWTLVLLSSLLALSGFALQKPAAKTVPAELSVRLSNVRLLTTVLAKENTPQALRLGYQLAALREVCGGTDDFTHLRVPLELAESVVLHLTPPNAVDTDPLAAQDRDTALLALKSAAFCPTSGG